MSQSCNCSQCWTVLALITVHTHSSGKAWNPHQMPSITWILLPVQGPELCCEQQTKKSGKENFCHPLTTIPHPCADLKSGGMWHLGTRVRGVLGSSGSIWDSTSSVFWAGWVGFDAGRSRTPKQRLFLLRCSIPASGGYFTFLLADSRGSCGQGVPASKHCLELCLEQLEEQLLTLLPRTRRVLGKSRSPHTLQHLPPSSASHELSFNQG